jgi:hypothetical protein
MSSAVKLQVYKTGDSPDPPKHLDALMLAYLIARTPFFAYGATRHPTKWIMVMGGKLTIQEGK